MLHRLRRLYWRLFQPRTLGVKCLVLRAGRVLLVRTTYDRYWALPGGGVNRGESFADAARRELRGRPVSPRPTCASSTST